MISPESKITIEAPFITALIENAVPLSFCVDIGASLSVFGFPMLERIHSETYNQDIPMQQSNNIFHFGGERAQLVGTVEHFLKTSENFLVYLLFLM